MWYIIERDDEPSIVGISKGQNPIHLWPGWTIVDGPFDTVTEAEDEIEKQNQEK